MLLVPFASAVIDKFKASQRTTTFLKRATGALFVSLGAKLAVER
jgi:threonine/homoserine/homoserine lactone efflux protein